MTAAACNKWSALFSLGEEFDDEDLLEADWSQTVARPPAGSSAAPASAPLRKSPTSHSRNPLPGSDSVSAESRGSSSEPGSLAPCRLPEPSAKGLRGLSNLNPSTLSISVPQVPSAYLRAPLGGASSTLSVQGPPVQPNPPPAESGAPKRELPPLDDFDDWDLDLEELVESESLVQSENASPAKRLRPSAAGHDIPAVSSFRGAPSASPALAPPRSFINTPRPSTFAPRGNPHAPVAPSTPVTPVGRTGCRFPRPVTPRYVGPPPPYLGGTGTPRAPQHQPKTLFQAVSPAPSPVLTPRPLHTPVLTNHLVQLVSAANKTPQRPRSDAVRSKTRRFPGPAGMLPQQISGRSMDDIVVTVPQTPAHGAVARSRSEVSSSQSSEEEEFSGGGWAAMKAELGLDERNPSCFLHSYSVVMVLRKAALRQLAKNKVPNMAVVLKSIVHTHSDAKAVFRDPTGEMQGTVHRRLLEEHLAELKPGAVLLLKQVGVFSPSHRNHYLNVTPNNLLRIYSPDGAFHTSTQLSQSAACETFRPVGGPVSQMELLYEEEEEEEEGCGAAPANPTACSNVVQPTVGPKDSEDAMWEADGLDELLGELPVDSYGM